MAPNPLIVLAVVLVAGVASGQLASRLRLPTVTGQILAGVLLGPSALGFLQHGSLESLQPVAQFAVGLIAVTIGSHLQLARLRGALRRLSWQLLLEVTITPTFVFAVVWLGFEQRWQVALLLAVVAVETAPGTTLSVVKQSRARGVFVRTLISAVALNNIACICLFAISRVVVRQSFAAGGLEPWDDALDIFEQIVASALLGITVGLGLAVAMRRVLDRQPRATAATLAFLVTIGSALHLGLAPLLACMALGITLANASPNRPELGHHVFSDFEPTILAAFFTLAGAELDFAYVVPAGVLTVAVVVARFGSKLGAAWLAMRIAGATDRVRRYLGLAMMPQAGVTVGLLVLLRHDPILAPIRDVVLAVGLTAVTINEIVGPLLTRYALVRSGDAGRDRVHLLDFLDEQHITTSLEADSKQAAIALLVDHICRAHPQLIERDELLASVLRRESEASTCIGEGLAVPHGELPSGLPLIGALGVSAKGIPSDAPDAEPIRAMLLLATPPGEHQRHLQVLATFARLFANGSPMRTRLAVASSPAHVYEVLHSGEQANVEAILDVRPALRD